MGVCIAVSADFRGYLIGYCVRLQDEEDERKRFKCVVFVCKHAERIRCIEFVCEIRRNCAYCTIDAQLCLYCVIRCQTRL